MSNITAYPLCWPDGWPRLFPWKRTIGNFKTSQNTAQLGLMDEIRKLGGNEVILSTNIKLRLDGLPYASQREPEDPGVAVYFKYGDKPMCFACDQYTSIAANMQAIRLTIEALRGIERWGASDMMERAFSGFMRLPAPGQTTARSWRQVLGLRDDEVTLEDARAAYRTLAKIYHPDHGGSHEAMAELNAAWDLAQEALL